ncbi:MAG: tetraacyldisaccharide 4'-kinase [Pirellulaceae bacterium]
MFDIRDLFTARQPTFGQRLARGCLRGLSIPYRAVMVGRNLAFDWRVFRSHRSALPVISVGNLSVGGTGKSPAVAWIARWLRERGIRVAILSRGYGQLDSGQNDEALELELQLPDVPHLQHWDRVASAKLAEEELEMQTLLLDDGFQHRRMSRDLDIVLLDATDPPCARRLLPGGLLREPMSALRRAHLVMLTRADQVAESTLAKLRHKIALSNPHVPIVHCRHRPDHLLSFPKSQLPLSDLVGKRVLAFCAIGNPRSFFQGLGELGVTLVDQRTWPDHHAYTAEDVAAIELWGQTQPEAELLVCTVKDWVKLQTPQIGRLPLLALAIELKMISGQADLEVALEQIVGVARCFP